MFAVVTLQPAAASRAGDVYEALRGALLAGAYPAGAHLTEAALCAELGVSRTPVREALQRLAEAGLLAAAVGRGMRVRRLSAEEAVGVYAVRAELDGLAAELLAARPGRAAALVPVRAALEALNGAAREGTPGDAREQTRLDLAFHRAVTVASGNATLLRLARDLEGLVALIKHQTGRHNAHPLAAGQHAAILEAIAGGDPVAARRVAREHVFTFSRLVQADLHADFTPPKDPHV